MTIISGKQLPFYNIAHDRDTEGNSIDLITICHRIEDMSKQDKYWLVEVGVKVDIKELEKKYEQEEEEYKNITNRLKMFWDDTRKCGETCFEKERECEDLLDDYQIKCMELARYEKHDSKRKEKDKIRVNKIKEYIKYLSQYVDNCRVNAKSIMRDAISDDEVDKTRQEFERQERTVLSRYDKIIRRLRRENIEIITRIDSIKSKITELNNLLQKVIVNQEERRKQLIEYWKETNSRQDEESKKIELKIEYLQTIINEINTSISGGDINNMLNILEKYRKKF